MLNRAYSVLTIKAVDAEKRVITGIATTPSPDRMGDIVEPKGVKYKNPLPLLLYHDSQRPVGTVKFDKPTDEGITFEARIPEVSDPPSLRDRIEEAWVSVKLGLVKGVSIGFRPIDPEKSIEVLPTGGWRFGKTEVLELSLVAIPANQDATIQTIKSIDAVHLAALGKSEPSERPAGATASRPVVHATRKTSKSMKTIAEQISAFEATREAKSAEFLEIQTAVSKEGRTKSAEEKEKFDTLKREIDAIDEELKDLREAEKMMVVKAASVAGGNPTDASQSRAAHHQVSVSDPKLAPGIGFARAAIAKMAAYLDHRNPVDIAKERWPSHTALHAYMQKAAVPAGTTTDAVWASPLVDQTNLAGEFMEFLRPRTIIGQLDLRRVPFNVRILGQTGGGTAHWVGQGAPKPLTSFAFNSTTLLWTKVAAISVITQELARFSTPSAEMLVRDSLAAAVIERIDIDFIDPANAGTANIKPASITNGLTALSSAGTSADNVRTDLMRLLSAFVAANQRGTRIALIMPETLALGVSLMTNSLGQPEFPNIGPNGGNLRGINVVTSQYAADASGYGNLVVAVNQDEVFLADDGQVNIDVSDQASLQMLDNPTNNSATATATTMVSMWQTNSLAIRAERFINWQKRRAEAVAYIDDVNWGSVGSPS